MSLQSRYMYDENKGKKLGWLSAVYCRLIGTTEHRDHSSEEDWWSSLPGQ